MYTMDMGTEDTVKDPRGRRSIHERTTPTPNAGCDAQSGSTTQEGGFQTDVVIRHGVRYLAVLGKLV